MTIKLSMPESVQETLATAARQAQSHLFKEEGELYDLREIEQALVDWLESSIEQLSDEAIYHLFEGDRTYAFNRRAFEDQLKKLKPMDRGHDAVA